MLGDMELVVHKFGVRRLCGHCLGIRGEHVGSDSTHILPLLDGARHENAFSGRLRMFRSDIEDTGAVENGENGENGDGILASPEALLVDADVLDGRGLATLEAACKARSMIVCTASQERPSSAAAAFTVRQA